MFKNKWLVATCLLILVSYSWLVTYGTWNFIGHETFSNSFDSLGDHLLKGTADVDPKTIRWEGQKYNDKIYIYFGLFPGALRILLNTIARDFWGQWARVSTLLAALLSVLAFTKMSAQALAVNRALDTSLRHRLHALLVFGFALSTPILYLVSCSRIYHEAHIWGLCGSMWALYSLTLLWLRPELLTRSMALFSIAFFVTLLSRLTYALPFALACPLILWRAISLERHKNTSFTKALIRHSLLMAPIAVAVGIQLWYNHQRFGSVFTLFNYASYYLKVEQIGGELNHYRIPAALYNYFTISSAYVTSSMPFFQMVTTSTSRPELFQQGWREQTIPYSIASSWLLLLAGWGIWSARNRSVPVFAKFLCLFLLLESTVILSYFFITQRYSAEFLPLLTWCLLIGLTILPLSRKGLSALSLLIMCSTYITVASTLHWSMTFNKDAPSHYRRALRQLFAPSIELPAEPDGAVHLSTLQPISEVGTYKPKQLNKNIEGAPLEAFGRIFDDGLGVHANSTITYTVPEGLDTFRAIIAPSTHIIGNEQASMEFAILNDHGEDLFRSSLVKSHTTPALIVVPLKGSSKISLQLTDGKNGIGHDHGNWIMPIFFKAQ